MKKIIWLKIRTNNSSTENIAQLWNKFYSENHIEKLWLGGKDIYAVYHNYENNENGDYDLLIGWESDISSDIYDVVKIKNNTYKAYTTNGDMPQKVIDAWWAIWKDSADRTYETDYELYTTSENPMNPHVTIYIWTH